MINQFLQQALQRCQLLIVAFGCIIGVILFPNNALADEEPPFDEVTLFVNVSGVGGKELEALIKDEQAYLSVTELFEFLKIKNKLSTEQDSVSGFFLSQSRPYVIDKVNNRIILEDKTFPLPPDQLINTLTGLFLRSDIFGKVFGLDCVFNFRSLSVSLSTKLDLPVIRERRQELMRSNISKLKKEIIADTVITKKYYGFNAGASDWSINTIQQPQGFNSTRANLRFGTILAGGETNISLNFDSRQKADLKQQYYSWRYVNNDNKTLRQITAGKIQTESTSSLYAPVVGFKLTNTPTTYRRSFDTYTINDFTEPDWVVELYINNILLDYVKADASGFFSFQVPLVYGNSVVKLRFFGPWGEERTSERNINVPYNFLPPGEMEYTVSGGMLEDGEQSLFSRAELKYGLNRVVTIGGGAEYVSYAGLPIPFINASFRLASNLLLTTDHTFHVRTRALLNYRLPSNFLFELNYTKYAEGQTVINQNFMEERKAMVFKSFRGRNFSGFSRLSISQLIAPKIKQTTADFLLSGSMKGVSANLSTYTLLLDPNYLNIYSNLAMAFRLPAHINIRPQIRYEYEYRRFEDIRVEIEKGIFKGGSLNLSWQNNFNYQSFGVGLHIDFSIARASCSVRQSNNRTVFSQSMTGGAIFDKQANYFEANNRSNVGKAGLVVLPFLDFNSNNKRDMGEPKVAGLKLKINGGRVQNDLKDSTIKIFDLEPYTSYLLELNPGSFDNIGWQLKNHSYKISVEPNKLKMIEIPVKVSGEVSGMIYAENSGGQGRVIVNFYRNDIFAARTVSESDGYFNFLGLSPGSYTARIDTTQLRKIKMTTFPIEMPFTIKTSLQGDMVSDIDFKLRKVKVVEKESPVLASDVKKKEEPVIEKISEGIALQKVTMPNPGEKKTVPELTMGFSIKISAFGDKARADIIQKNLAEKFEHPTTVFFEGNNYFRLSILGFNSREKAEALVPDLTRHGFKDIYIEAPREKILSAAPVKKAPEILITNEIPKSNSNLRYKIVTGKILNQIAIQAAQRLILTALNTSSTLIQDGESFRLQITGFADSSAAKIAGNKLLKAGMQKIYIEYYREQLVEMERAAPVGNPHKTSTPQKTSSDPDIKSGDKTDLLFAVVIGKATDLTEISKIQKLILMKINKPATAIQSGKFFRLMILGFSDKKAAEKVYQELLSVGLTEGYILPYKEKFAQMVPVK